MKNSIVGVAACLVIATSATAAPVTESRAWTKSYPVASSAPQLTIRNIWGNIRVRAGDPGEISITVDEMRSAPTQSLFDRSLEILKLDVEADSNGLTIIVGERNQMWRRREPCRECRVDYQFDLRVPAGTRLDIGTVTDGTIDVAGITGEISASNVNGPVAVHGMHHCETLESVNGVVEASFVLAPGSECGIETVNGDITLGLPAGSGVDVALNLLNGRVVSEFPLTPFSLPAQVEHRTVDGRNHYRIQQLAGLRIDRGGPAFSVSSLNGDFRIQESQ